MCEGYPRGEQSEKKVRIMFRAELGHLLLHRSCPARVGLSLSQLSFTHSVASAKSAPAIIYVRRDLISL
jgi:hypothetical protein